MDEYHLTVNSATQVSTQVLTPEDALYIPIRFPSNEIAVQGQIEYTETVGILLAASATFMGSFEALVHWTTLINNWAEMINHRLAGDLGTYIADHYRNTQLYWGISDILHKIESTSTIWLTIFDDIRSHLPAPRRDLGNHNYFHIDWATCNLITPNTGYVMDQSMSNTSSLTQTGYGLTIGSVSLVYQPITDHVLPYGAEWTWSTSFIHDGSSNAQIQVYSKSAQNETYMYNIMGTPDNTNNTNSWVGHAYVNGTTYYQAAASYNIAFTIPITVSIWNKPINAANGVYQVVLIYKFGTYPAIEEPLYTQDKDVNRQKLYFSGSGLHLFSTSLQ